MLKYAYSKSYQPYKNHSNREKYFSKKNILVISNKNDDLQKQIEDFKNENDSLKEKVKSR